MDNLDRFGDLGFLVFLIFGLEGFLIDFERHRHTAGEVETQLQARLRATQEFIQKDIVPLFDILEGRLKTNIRKILRKIDFLLFADLLEGHELAGGGTGLFPG